MKRQTLATLFAAVLMALASVTALAASDNEPEDTDTRMVAARVVEVNDMHISVIARTGVEHVIAIDDSGTKVKVDGRLMSLKDLKEGDIVTVELDEQNSLKFARNIDISTQTNSQVARARP